MSVLSGLLTHLKELVELKPNPPSRHWHFFVLGGVCVGLPVLIGSFVGGFSQSILAAMGAIVILYLPADRLSKRMVTLSVCSFGFLACFALGMLSALYPWLTVMMLAFTTFLAVTVCRYFSIPQPAGFFFVLISCVASHIPYEPAKLFENIGLVAAGGLLSCVVALFYSFIFPAKPATEVQRQPPDVVNITLAAAVISVCVSGSLALGMLLGLDNPYWVPISCMAILQGINFKQIWHRKLHRITGTLLGLGVVWLIFSFNPSHLQLAIILMLLQGTIEFLVARNYALAVMFITPLTVIFAEANSTTLAPIGLVAIRFVDICLGSFIGFVGGWLLHRSRWVAGLEDRLKKGR